MKKQLVITLLAVAVILLSFRKKDTPVVRIPPGWPQPTYDFSKNPLSQQRIALGRMLFYDPILSKDSTISCASCHSPFNAFAHTDHDLSHGINGKIGKRNAPALMNLAWSSSFMWDGAINHLDVQSLAPISDSMEMNEDIAHVAAKLQAGKRYRELFRSAYGSNKVTGEYILKSLSQFMLTLVSAGSKYDSVKRRQARFTANEEKGYILFTRNCASCHTEPLFTNQQFENNGLYIDDVLKDNGRMKISHEAGDSLRFKVPTLRNIQYTYPYMHDGRFKNLSQAINHYILGIQRTPTLGEALKRGVYMNNEEKADLIAFLFTLSDKNFISNADHSFPR